MSIQETLLQKLQHQGKDIEHIKDDMQFMRRQLFGNGAVGIDEQVRLNTSFREGLRDIAKQVDMNSKFINDVRRLFWIFATTIVGQIIGAVMLWIK
jgi:hypothetical protein